jgi:hypothetical protein
MHREGGIDYLIASMADLTNHVTDLIRRMKPYRHRVIDCTESLNPLNLQLQLTENEDIDETFGRVIQLMDDSKERPVAASASTDSYSI